MAWPDKLQPMSLPVIGAPLFIISNPQLVLAQCKNGVIGAFPGAQRAAGNWCSTLGYPKSHPTRGIQES